MSSSQIEACLARMSRGEPVTDSALDIYDYLASDDLEMAGVLETDGKAVVLDLSAGQPDVRASAEGTWCRYAGGACRPGNGRRRY